MNWLGALSVFLLAVVVALDWLNFDFSCPPVMDLGLANLLVLTAWFIIWSYRQRLYGFLLKKIRQTLMTLFIIGTLTFVLLRLMPGGPFDQDRALPPEVLASIEAKYRLNDPLPRQYARYMLGLMKGDLGESYKYIGRSVSEVIIETLPVSVHLGAYALLFSFLLGVPLGVAAAAARRGWQDKLMIGLSMIGVSIPSFLLATILVLFFSSYLRWLPSALWESSAHYVLPIIALGLRPLAIVARLTRASVLDQLGADYVRTAQAKGLAPFFIFFKHVLKNSLIPVLSVSGPLVAGILTGSFVVEQIFGIPGVAREMILSVSNRDYPLVMGLTLVYSTLLVTANLAADVLARIVDPRIDIR